MYLPQKGGAGASRLELKTHARGQCVGKAPGQHAAGNEWWGAGGVECVELAQGQVPVCEAGFEESRIKKILQIVELCFASGLYDAQHDIIGTAEQGDVRDFVVARTQTHGGCDESIDFDINGGTSGQAQAVCGQGLYRVARVQGPLPGDADACQLLRVHAVGG